MESAIKHKMEVTILILAHVWVAETKAALKGGTKNCTRAEHWMTKPMLAAVALLKGA